MNNIYDAIDCAVIRLDDRSFYINLSSKTVPPRALHLAALRFLPRALIALQGHFPLRQSGQSTLKNPKTGLISEIQEFTLQNVYCDDSIIAPCRQIVNRVMETLRHEDHPFPQEAPAEIPQAADKEPV